jgi:pyridoxine kinase
LTGKKYAPSFPDEELHEMLFALCREGPEMAVITGIEEAGMAKVVGFSQSENQIYEVRNPMVGKHYPGTGDIYASVLTGSLLSGEKLPRAMGRASYFNYHAIRETHRLGTPPREGVALEKMLSLLLENGAFFDAAKMSAGR